MKKSSNGFPKEKLISIKSNPKIKGLFDVELCGIENLKKYGSVECHLVLYPYSRNIGSQDMTFSPFEEYVKDIQSRHRSVYSTMVGRFNHIFGLFLCLLFAAVFYSLKPQSLYSIEAIVSIFALYVIGRDSWAEIENMLVQCTLRWRLRFQESYYQYRLDRGTTLTTYSALAKHARYNKSSLMPAKMDFIQKSNSQTVRMFFLKKDLEKVEGDRAHILSMSVKPSLLRQFHSAGFLFGVKLSFNKRLLFLTKATEIFQSIHGKEIGCLDKSGEWVTGKVFMKKVLQLARIKLYFSERLLDVVSFIDGLREKRKRKILK